MRKCEVLSLLRPIEDWHGVAYMGNSAQVLASGWVPVGGLDWYQCIYDDIYCRGDRTGALF